MTGGAPAFRKGPERGRTFESLDTVRQRRPETAKEKTDMSEETNEAAKRRQDRYNMKRPYTQLRLDRAIKDALHRSAAKNRRSFSEETNVILAAALGVA